MFEIVTVELLSLIRDRHQNPNQTQTSE